MGRALSGWLGALLLLAVVGLFLVAPIAVMLMRSFITADGFTLDVWSGLLDSPQVRKALLTSIALGATCAAASTLIGTPLAWLTSRLAARPRAAWLGIFNVAAHFGGIGLAFAYVITFGVFGVVTLLLHGVGIDFQPPARDSFAALAITYEYANVPLFVLLLLPAMGIVRDEWSEAAQVASATRWQFWRRIGLPLLAPFIAGGALLSFTWAIGIYGIAYALAGTSPAAPTRLLTLQIGQTIADDAVTGTARAGALSVLLIALALAALATYRLMVRRGLRWFGGHAPSEASTTSASAIRRPSGGGNWLRRGLFVAVGSLLGLPLAAIGLYSVATRWATGVLPEGYTLNTWLTTWADDRAVQAVLTSLSLSTLTTLVVLVLVVPAVYWARTVNPRVRAALEIAAAIPFALPFLVIGLAMLQFSGMVAPGLQGTYPLLLAGYVAITFPFVYWAVDGAMAAAGVERLSQAAEACGARRRQIILRVVLPNIRAGLASGALLAFATVMGEYALVSVLASSIQTIPVWSVHLLLQRGGDPGYAPLAVVTLSVFSLLLVLALVVSRLTRGRAVREAAFVEDA
ncbi:MAG: putative spermidine/putrescine transport system permease protein [Chloroflexota bacterium]|jgi:putative spermidine/putrescine transport system permease protein|nr:putative spermidine/putrescine transport system permease protein [Chloroflexota bacterium]